MAEQAAPGHLLHCPVPRWSEHLQLGQEIPNDTPRLSAENTRAIREEFRFH